MLLGFLRGTFPLIRFNGAAPARARNVVQFSQPFLLAAASMGPRPRGRGMIPGVAIGKQQFYASMGPRPRGRGMSEPPAGRVTLRFTLQWGRARAGAECWPFHQFGRKYVASMGPRPRGRGMPTFPHT